MEDGSLYFQYLALRGRLQRSKWRDKYYLLLDQHFSDVLDAPSTGCSVYFGRTTRRDNFVDQVAVTALDRNFPPVFVRQNISAAYRVGLSSILFTSYNICVMVRVCWNGSRHSSADVDPFCETSTCLFPPEPYQYFV